jgi:hypothetical protein
MISTKNKKHRISPDSKNCKHLNCSPNKNPVDSDSEEYHFENPNKKYFETFVHSTN